MTDDLYFNTSEIKLSITSLYIISDTPKYGIICTGNSDVINSFISEILKYESLVIVSSTEKPCAVLFTPFIHIHPRKMKNNKHLSNFFFILFKNNIEYIEYFILYRLSIKKRKCWKAS